MGRPLDPNSLSGKIRAIAVGAAKEFRRPKDKTLLQWQEYIGAIVAQARKRKGFDYVFTTQQTHDGVRVTRVE